MKYIIANWKAFVNHFEQAQQLCQSIADVTIGSSKVVILPPYVYLHQVRNWLKDTAVQVGAQDMSEFNDQARTGSITISMLKDIPVDYVLLGHSELRMYEDDKSIKNKIQLASFYGIKVILCVGEPLEEKDNWQIYIKNELFNVLDQLEIKNTDDLIISYEPIWAIGAHEPADKEHIYQVHSFIKQQLALLFSPDKAANIHIIYGGSVDLDNIQSILSMSCVDGVLVGRASIDKKKFKAMIDN